MTNIEGYDNAVILTQLVNGINSTDLYGLKDEIKNNQELIEKSTTALNNIGTDPESMAKLNIELHQLEESHSSMLASKNKLIAKKTEIMQQEVSINEKNTNLETWTQNHRFDMWNYTNKISKLDVHYTSFGIMGIQISYRDLNKTGELIGTISDKTSSIETVNFSDDEWLVQIQITNSSANTLTSVLCNSISFYTSKNPSGTPPKITIPASSDSNVVNNKKYYINPKAQPWLNHKKDAEAQGATLACFETSLEINKMLTELGQDRYKYGSFYIGLYHPNALIENNLAGGGKRNHVPSNINSAWQWVDGTPYNPNSTNWNGGEPNNRGPGENVGQMYSNGKINDLTKTNSLAAIYQKKITNTNEQTPTMNGKHISNFTIKPSLTATYDSITSPDMLQKTNAESAVKSSKEVGSHIDDTLDILDSSIKDITEAMAKINININHVKNKLQTLNELNNIGKETLETTKTIEPKASEGFANIGQNLFSSYISNIKEGMVTQEQHRGYFLDAINRTNNNITGQTDATLSQVDALQQKETANAISEYIIKKDNIFTNVLTDYMLNDGKKNDFEEVYSKIAQQNTEKERKIEINTYYDKAYKEYTNILIVIIFACIILVPIVIANKNSLLPSNITNIMVVVVIFITICYIIYKLIDIYMRDSKDFDKILIPYDREAAVLEKSGEITRKKNLLSTFARTCIGQDCCPGTTSGLVFDPALNKCVVKDTFMNYMEGGPVGGYLDETLNGYLDGLFGKSNQPGSYSLVQPFVTTSQLVSASLNNSDPDSFNKTQNNIQVT
uniref:C-type lectin domain-containing protein n=1 Tax=viral metagenome TaxID=1070528 RepID=A0A6C0H4B9_9ZZZZ